MYNLLMLISMALSAFVSVRLSLKMADNLNLGGVEAAILLICTAAASFIIAGKCCQCTIDYADLHWGGELATLCGMLIAAASMPVTGLVWLGINKCCRVFERKLNN